MTKKTILILLSSLVLLFSFYVVYIFGMGQKGTVFEFISYKIFPNWYLASFIGRIVLGGILFFTTFSFVKLNNKFFSFLMGVFGLLLLFVLLSCSFNEKRTLIDLSTSSTILLSIVILLGLVGFIFRKKIAFISGKWAWITLVLTMVAGQTFIFITNPLFPDEFVNGEGLISEEIEKSHPVSSSIEGKVLYIYAIPGCPYCKKAIHRITKTISDPLIKERIIIRFPGTYEDQERFNNYIKYLGSDLTLEIMGVDQVIVENNGGSFPKFYLVEDGKLIRFWKSEHFNYNTLQNLEEILQ